MRAARPVVMSIILLVLAAACSGEGTSTTVPPTSQPEATTSADVTTSTAAPTSTTATLPPAPDVTSTLLGDEEVVFDWSEDGCGPDNHPDLPTLVYRDGDGVVNLILSSPTIHRMTGPDFDSLAVDCDPIRLSAEDPDPSQYRFREWMGSLWTEDGETIHAVIHNEFHGDDASFALSRRDFSDEQGGGGWSYLGRTASGEFELQYSGGEWRFGETLCLIADWGTHPDSSCEAVRRWTVPQPGAISIWAHVADAGIGGGNGVEVGIDHNGETLWTHMIEEGDQEPAIAELEATVEGGDTLDFWVGSRGDAGWDATQFRIEINYGPRPCTLDDREGCLMMALTYSRSTDGGDSFTTPPPPENLVAAVPQRYEPDHGVVGIWQPSNIVEHPSDGYWYMLAQVDVHQGSRDVTGMCLLRTDDLSDPAAWRAWDGEGFGYEFVDPYQVEDPDEQRLCRSVVGPPAWSLTWNTLLERFVIVTEIPGIRPAGIYLMTSSDLVHWSAPELIMESRIGFATGFATPFEAYPTLVDHSSESMSFETTGEEPHLYFTRINGYDPLDFDLLRVPIRLEVEN